MEVTQLFSVKGKNVLITGGGSGIGKMIATGFVANGATVFISSRSKKDLDATCSELNEKGPGTCTAVAADLSTVAGCVALANTLKQEHKLSKLHVLINNSGFTWGEPFEKFQERGWDRVMDLNVKSVFFLTKELLPLLKAATTDEDPARIINVGSVAGEKPQQVPTYSYDASKAALHHLSKKMASDFSQHRITVNVLAPGVVPSRMSKQLLTYNSKEALAEGTPLGRLGTPEDMAGCAIFLSSRASAWVTGVVLSADGGHLIDVRGRSKL
jgi:NAD(P)-dependent dehydrogenase (short-subunit alcohol dehydrogenase family)